MQFSCKKCGKLLGYEDLYESDKNGDIPSFDLIKSKKEPRCTKCGYLFLDPFRKCRRLTKLIEKKERR